MVGGAECGGERKRDAELRRRADGEFEGLARGSEGNACSRGERQDANRAGMERMLP